MIQDQLLKIRGGDIADRQARRLRRNHQRAVVGVLGRDPMRSTDEAGIERNDVEKAAKSQLTFGQPPTDGRASDSGSAGSRNSLHGIVPRLAMDIDGTREIRRAIVVDPMIVGEPTIGIGEGNEFARA